MTPAAAAVDRSSALDAPRLLASWYTEGLCDAVGDRLLMFDNSGEPSLELLRFRPALAETDGFEDAVRERVDALQAFKHTAYSQVRAVQRLDSGDLALVSTFTDGKRVSDIFHARHGRAGVHPAFAACLIREMTAAVADLHRKGQRIAHGGLTPDRVILTPEGRLVIVEHVLGAALERLQLPATRLWRELGLVAIEESGCSRLDQRTDVVQIAWIALSLLVGRRIAALEYPRRVDALLDEFVGATRGSSPALVSALRRWLERALHTTTDAFESAVHAEAALGDLRHHDGFHASSFDSGGMAAEQLGFEQRRQLPPIRAVAPEIATFEQRADDPEPSNSENSAMAIATEFAGDAMTRPAPVLPLQAPRTATRPARAAAAGWIVAAVLGVVAAAEAVWIGRAELVKAAVLPAPPVRVVIDSPQGGDAVVVDGRQIGVTPLTVALTSDMRSLRVRTNPAAEPPLAQTPPAVERPAESAAAAAIAQAGARERRGGVRIASAVELQVLEGERVLGSSADGPVVATAGTHELDFINSALGFRVRQVVDIKAGQIVPLKIAVPDGRISVNAVPWAQVSINGTPLGETPLANLPLPVGEHEITFRHPQLGEQKQKVIVKSNALTRVSATFTR